MRELFGDGKLNKIWYLLFLGLWFEVFFIEVCENFEKKLLLVFVYGSYYVVWCWVVYWLFYFLFFGYDCYVISFFG